LGKALGAALAACALLAGCGGGGQEDAAPPPATCDDTAFRAQDEELYVTKTAVSNAIAAGGDPSALLLDLQRARKALAGYVDAHPPCADALSEIASTERTAIGSLDAAIASLQDGRDAGPALRSAQTGLTAVQNRLAGG